MMCLFRRFGKFLAKCKIIFHHFKLLPAVVLIHTARCSMLLKNFKLEDNAVSRSSHDTVIHYYFAAVVGSHHAWARWISLVAT